MLLQLSVDDVLMLESCPRSYYLRAVQKITPPNTRASLAFGGCIQASVREYLHALSLGRTPLDPEVRFVKRWTRECSNTVLDFAATQSPAFFEHMGCELMRALPAAWTQSGWQVVIDRDGEPLLNRTLRLSFAACPGSLLEFSGRIGCLVRNAQDELLLVHLHTVTQPHSALYARCCTELTAAQLLLASHRRALGLEPIAGLVLWDFVKRKTAAQIAAPLLVPPRSKSELLSFVQKLLWHMDDVRSGRFVTTPRLRFDSPCRTCGVARPCIDGLAAVQAVQPLAQAA